MIASYYCTILLYSSSSTQCLTFLLQAFAYLAFSLLHSALPAHIEDFKEVVGYVQAVQPRVPSTQRFERVSLPTAL